MGWEVEEENLAALSPVIVIFSILLLHFLCYLLPFSASFSLFISASSLSPCPAPSVCFLSPFLLSLLMVSSLCLTRPSSLCFSLAHLSLPTLPPSLLSQQVDLHL